MTEEFKDLLIWQYLHGMNILPPSYLYEKIITAPDLTEHLAYVWAHYDQNAIPTQQ